MKKILFICMGNICRSPTAQGFFEYHLQQSPYQQLITADSAGTHAYHVGQPPDRRSQKAARDFGISIGQQRARQVQVRDFFLFEHILAMDPSNLQHLQSLQPESAKASLDLILNYHPSFEGKTVPDPYYGDSNGFRQVCELLDAACLGLLKTLESTLREQSVEPGE